MLLFSLASYSQKDKSTEVYVKGKLDIYTENSQEIAVVYDVRSYSLVKFALTENSCKQFEPFKEYEFRLKKTCDSKACKFPTYEFILGEKSQFQLGKDLEVLRKTD
jgi:hypothetical protein